MTNNIRVKPKKAAVIGSTLLFTTFATTFPCPSQYLKDFEEAAAFRIPPITSFASPTEYLRKVSPATAQEMIANLRNGGMPVSAIADIMRVERKTIYAWLSGGEVRKPNLQRADQVHALLTGVLGVDVRGVYRFWNTKIDGNKTLRDLMTADNIDDLAVRSALDNLRPAALRAMASEKKMSRQGPTNAVLDEIPEAGANG
jgi:hypothetical protein